MTNVDIKSRVTGQGLGLLEQAFLPVLITFLKSKDSCLNLFLTTALLGQDPTLIFHTLNYGQ